MIEVQSKIRGVAWPGIPPDRGCQLFTLLFQLEQSQWWSAEEIERHQLAQLRLLLAHAYRTAPYYFRPFQEFCNDPEFPRNFDEFRRLPLLRRIDLQNHAAAVRSNDCTQHGSVAESVTSGSTGSPVQVCNTGFTRLLSDALSLRQHLWFKRDLRLKLAAIRFLDHNANAAERLPAWSAGTFGVIATGPSAVFSIQRPIAEQAEWLKAENPDYLLTYPTNLYALLLHIRDNGLRLPRLREVRTIGESLEPYVRRACQDILGVPLVDSYSAVEVGSIATQCPAGTGYHVHAEHLIVEILDDHGRPCSPGETGRVVVTDLQNVASPLIRYEIGDYATVGETCVCGRGLPVLSTIMGRTRNMAILPDGRRLWPVLQLDISAAEAASQLPVRQFQMIQRSLHSLELNLVVTRPLDEVEEWMVRQWVEGSLGYPFDLEIRYVDSIPRSAAGKYEEFRCDVEGSPT